MSNNKSRKKRIHPGEKALISTQISANLVLLRVGDKDTSKIIKDHFNAGEVIVGRLGEVWAAFWQASSESATKRVLKAKSRSALKTFSVLAPVELMQLLIDRNRVSRKYLSLIDNRSLLLQSVSDKAFLRIPISFDIAMQLAVPAHVISKEHDAQGEYYSMHCITGQDSDYSDVQEAMSPSTEISHETQELKLYIQKHLIAITSWNVSGSGSNYSDMHQAAKLAIENKIKILLLPNELRKNAHGSYGIISLIASEQANKMVPRRPPISKDGYWYKIMQNFLKNAKQAEKIHPEEKSEITAIEQSGF